MSNEKNDKINRELLPNLARDPFSGPLVGLLTAQSRLNEIVSKLLGWTSDPNHMRTFALLLPTTKPKQVIDATPTGRCTVCQQPCWVSSSTGRYDGPPIEAWVCSDCIGPEGRELFRRMVLGR